MLVTTRNSVYRVTENPPTGAATGKFTVEKVRDLVPGGHPNVREGDVFECNSIHIRVGERMAMSEVTRHEHKGGWRACRNLECEHGPVTTTPVIDIGEEPR